MIKIFISYSRENQDIINTLSQDFNELGHQVWIDKKLTGGQAWWGQILERIKEYDLFVFALSPESLDSQACKLERAYAHALHKAILPVLVADGVSIKLLPPELSAIQHVDYRNPDKKAAFSLYKALTTLPDLLPLPDPLPEQPDVPVSYLGSLKDQIDTRQTLGFEAQSALLLQLRQGLRNQDDINDVRELLRRMRKRGDLQERITVEIDTLLDDIPDPDPDPDPPEPIPNHNNLIPKNIALDNATEDIKEILQDVLENKKTWVLRDTDYNLEISSDNNKLMVQTEWESWSNLWLHVKVQCLRQLRWNVDMKQILLSGGAVILALLSYGLALLIPIIRKTIKMRRASHIWPATQDKGRLTGIAMDIVLALKTIAPDSETITTEKK